MSSSNGTGALPPLILTFRQLKRVVKPVIGDDHWGNDTVGDLWRLLAPTPQSIPNSQNEKRIVAPGTLMKWLGDVLTRRGLPLDEAAKAYVQLFQNSEKFG